MGSYARKATSGGAGPGKTARRALSLGNIYPGMSRMDRVHHIGNILPGVAMTAPPNPVTGPPSSESPIESIGSTASLSESLSSILGSTATLSSGPVGFGATPGASPPVSVVPAAIALLPPIQPLAVAPSSAPVASVPITSPAHPSHKGFLLVAGLLAAGGIYFLVKKYA